MMRSSLHRAAICTVLAALLSILAVGCARVPGIKPSATAKQLAPVTRSQELEMARAIHGYFDERMYTLSGTEQGHLATRLYRASGDDKYVRPIVFLQLFHADQLLSDITHLSDSSYVRHRYELYYDSMSERTASRRERKQFLAPWQREIYDNSLVSAMYKWHQYGLDKMRYGTYYATALDYLRGENLGRFYLNHDVIRNHPVQAVNGVYYAYSLGIGDMRDDLRKAYTEIYLNKPGSLSKADYQSMIYGLTHFVIGASDYYEHFCTATEYAWILDYFRKNIAEIVERCSPDIVAEVGLSFVLCKVPREEIPFQISATLANSFNKRMGYVSRSAHDLDYLEHRNIVAYLYLADIPTLHPGPDISQYTKYDGLMEMPIDDIEGK